jgi:flagellar biosynthesis chaperone FliJ
MSSENLHFLEAQDTVVSKHQYQLVPQDHQIQVCKDHWQEMGKEARKGLGQHA